MVEKIIRFQTSDGALHETKAQAEIVQAQLELTQTIRDLTNEHSSWYVHMDDIEQYAEEFKIMLEEYLKKLEKLKK
jgi:hypothetical protein